MHVGNSWKTWRSAGGWAANLRSGSRHSCAVFGWVSGNCSAQSFAKGVADRVVFMDGGVIVEQGPPSQVISAPVEERTRAFLSSVLNH